jgi:cell division protein FtsW
MNGEKSNTIVKIRSYDPALLFGVMALVGLGLVMVYSSSSALALKSFGSDIHYVKRQFIFFLVGVIALIITRNIPFRSYYPLAYPFLGVTLLLLGLVHVPGLGVTAGGATRWINLGVISFQPSEAARLVFVMYLAYSMTKKHTLMNEFAVGVVPHLLVAGIVCALLMSQPDFGSSVLLCAVTGIMLFAGGVRLKHLVMLVVPAVVVGALFVLSSEYRIRRMIAVWDPWSCAQDAGYQVVHSLMAFGTGGIVGTGVGNSYQKLFYLPEPHTDFIFSVLGEEMGLWGVLAVVILYGLIVWRGLVIARQVPDTFGSYLATGITATLGLQACTNMAVTMGLLPTKGLTLPFISYGGTSLVINMAAIGILINIASYKGPREVRAVRRRKALATKDRGSK